MYIRVCMVDSDIVLTDAFINEHFGGTSTLNVILTADENGKMKSPEVLKLMDEMQEKVDSKLQKSLSITFLYVAETLSHFQIILKE